MSRPFEGRYKKMDIGKISNASLVVCLSEYLLIKMVRPKRGVSNIFDHTLSRVHVRACLSPSGLIF